jgi:sterol desaturase/sphingolipid hydroxylase (fatty acid hydroxylase superfamily)
MLEHIEEELESTDRAVGHGWFAGVLGLALSIAALGLVLCYHFPELLTSPRSRPLLSLAVTRHALQLALVVSFSLSCFSMVRRPRKWLGAAGLALTLVAVVLGGARSQSWGLPDEQVYFGLDWFILRLMLLSLVFVPFERIFPHRAEQPLFREEWGQDLAYFLIASLLVQTMTFLSLAPAAGILHVTHWAALRRFVAAQPILLQVFEIMFVADLFQYGIHRLFHRIPLLWRIHSVHHSSQMMDWMATNRLHIADLLVQRAAAVLPIVLLGFSQTAIQLFLLFLFFSTTFIHANMRWDLGPLQQIFVTPRFHHWHHGIEPQAVDVNFAVTFPWIDRMFGTYYLPSSWPSGYGISGNPVPYGYMEQLRYPFRTPA